MKNIYSIAASFIMAFFITTGLSAQNEFITTWKTDNSGTSNDSSITIPTNSSYIYNYDVDWDNDGIFDTTGVTGSITHTFNAPGTYTIRIQGTFPAIYFDNSYDKNKITSVDQWGSLEWESFADSFNGCRNLTINAMDSPDLTNVTSMKYAFNSCKNLTAGLSAWDVSNVNNMEYMFSETTSYSEDLSAWNVSKVTSMKYMFYKATVFSQDLNTWDVRKVTNMNGMFNRAELFNGNISNWNVDSVTNMAAMFYSASSFNQDISSWNVSKVSDFSGMFRSATEFNQDLSLWDVSNADDLDYMFSDAIVFNQDISAWDVGNVKYMEGMFYNASTFNQDISGWDVSNVTIMAQMFYQATAFDQNLGKWDMSSISSYLGIDSMLENCNLSSSNYDSILIGWASQDLLNGISLGSVNTYYCSAKAARDSLVNSSGWLIFDLGQSCSDTDYFITNWKTDNSGTSGSTSITIPTNSAYTYDYDIDWDNDGIIDEAGVTGDITHDFGSAGTYTIRIRGTFPSIYFNNGGDKEKILSVDQWGTIAWESFNSAFYGCENLTITATDSPALTNVSEMNKAFRDCIILTGDFSTWNVENVTSLGSMFRGASAFNQDISNWNVGEVTSMWGMFRDATSFNQDLSNWNVAKVTDMGYMFYQAANFNQNISNWNVNNVLTMKKMFYNAVAFNQNIGKWYLSSIETANKMFEMLNNCTFSSTNYDAILNSWAFQNLQDSVDLGSINAYYCNAAVSRDTLINKYNWIITDLGQACSDSEYFITTWKTDNSGSSGDTEITIPVNSSYAYNYDVDWNNDGIFDEFGLTGSVTHDYGTAGTYTIRIQGTFPAIYFNDSGDKEKIISVDQWGSIVWGSMKLAFYGCTNLEYTATDIPDLSGVESFYYTFADATLFNGDISGWDVSNATDMSYMFSNASTFDADISSWDVSNVTYMYGMFYNASSFSGDLSNWNVSEVLSMYNMFANATSFNSNISIWDVSNARFFSSMFYGATLFDQDLANWDITNKQDSLSLNNMFKDCGLSISNYDAILTAWAQQSVNTNLKLGTVSTNYCQGAEARDSLITIYGWTIDDEGQSCDATDYFITTWKTDMDTPGDSSITIPTNSSYTYSYDIDWNNDGIFDTLNVSDDITHYYDSAGTYTIQIRGAFPAIKFRYQSIGDKLLSIDNWGTIQWEDMSLAFAGCENLNILATDAPDLSLVSSMESCFTGCESLNADLNHWDVSTIENMEYLFNNATSFNGDISSWKVSNVTSMYYLFSDATSFNGDISNWNVSKVSDMRRMFSEASSFNGDISNWDVANVMDMDHMFYKATIFNGDLSSWDVSSVESMRYMFYDVTSFNSNISSWNVTNVEEMHYMFLGAASFNTDISGWDVSSVYDMTDMFKGATSFNQNIGSWNITSVTDMDSIFHNSNLSTSNYDAILNGWALQNVQSGVELTNPDINYCQSAFAKDALISTHGWSVTDNGQACENTDYFITTWYTDPDSVNSSAIVIPTKSGYYYSYDVDWDNDGVFDTLNITDDFYYEFDSVGTYTIQIRGTFPAITFYELDFANTLLSVDQWGSLKWYDMSYAFAGCENMNITATDAPDLTQVTSMDRCFKNCTNLNADLNHWDVSTVVDMYELFKNASIFNGDISSWDVSKVQYMGDMFENVIAFNGDLSGWDVSSTTDMSEMFLGATAFNSDISSWNTSSVTDMSEMFYEASDFNQNIGNWDVSSVADMNLMFYRATSFNDNIGNWNVSNVADMSDMFFSATSFDQNIGNWDISNVTEMEDMLHNVNLSISNYDSILIGWVGQNVTSNVDLGTIKAYYCEGSEARDSLINTYSWTITDNGLETEAPVADAATLADITAECEVTELTAPAATDNCTDAVYVSHDATLPISGQGTTVVTWTFEDGNGNTSTQAQNIVITDETEPEISCVAYHVINTSEDYYMIQGTELDPENITDNCQVGNVINDFTNTETLDGAILPSGSNTITWTVSDMAGNINTCTSEIMVSISTSMEITQSGNIVLFPNPAKDEVFIKGIEEFAGEVSINIYDVKGSLIYMGQILGNKVDVSTFEPGVYFLQLSTSEEISTIKFIKN